MRVVDIEFGHPVLRECALAFAEEYKTEYAHEVKELLCPNVGIENLEGLQYFINLADINMSLNPISELTPIRELFTIRSIELNGTNVSDISPLMNLANLEHLFLSGTPVTDVSGLVNTDSIQWLILEQNIITNGIRELTNLIKLKLLILTDTVVPCAQFEEFLKDRPPQVDIRPSVQRIRDSCSNPVKY